MASRRSLGIKILHDPEQSGNGPPDLDLVLVHGLNGDRISTWTYEPTDTLWPKDLLPKKRPQTRVMSFGYSANIYGSTSKAGIRDNSRSLLGALDLKRDDNAKARSIVFVAHSLGGLIVKQALRFAKNESQYISVASSTRGILLFGTPHHGSDEDKWLSLAEKFAPLGGATEESRSPLVAALARSSRDVFEISEDFCHLADNYYIASFYELCAWPGTDSVIVDRGSALMMLRHEVKVPVEATHAEMVQFEDEEDPGFEMVVARIEEAARSTYMGLVVHYEARVTGTFGGK